MDTFLLYLGVAIVTIPYLLGLLVIWLIPYAFVAAILAILINIAYRLWRST